MGYIHSGKRVAYSPLAGSSIRQKQPKNKRIIAFVLLASILNVSYNWYANHQRVDPIVITPSVQDGFSWIKLTPTKHIDWTPCFGEFQCSRLDVPMDYNSTDENGPRVTVAAIRLPAPVPVTDPRYAGPVLINPGGPGGSGVNTMFTTGNILSKIVNPSSADISNRDARFYDIVSWDPRGVNNTLPHLDCYPDARSFDIAQLQAERDGYNRLDPASLPLEWARSESMGGECSARGGIADHMTTRAVVKDIVSIVERHGEWRELQAQKWLASEVGQKTTNGKAASHSYSKESILERTRWRKGEEKISYWGFSYGTILGATLAAMEPQRVHRNIIDGVCDPDDYYRAEWLLNLRDTDAIMDRFFSYCSQVGPETCALNTGNFTAAELERQVEAAIASLRIAPLAVPGTKARGPEILTYTNVMQMIRNVLYKPIAKFPMMAVLLDDLINGNGTLFAEWKPENVYAPVCPLKDCSSSPDEECYFMGHEVTEGILCSDAESIASHTKEDAWQRRETLYKQSKWMGESWATITLPCIHWKAKATQKLAAPDIKGDLAHPMLIIGNTLDPVTPVYNAHTVSQKFPGSVVLEQNSEGHCTLSAPSACTINHVRTYFQTGALPEPGTICQPNEVPFLGKVEAFSTLSAEDAELLEAIKAVGNGPRAGPLSL